MFNAAGIGLQHAGLHLANILALAQLKGFAPASSVSWALELRPVERPQDDAFWRMDKDALATGEGYVNEKTTLWTPEGEMAALGYQVVAVYG